MHLHFVPLSDDNWGKDELVTANSAEVLMVVVGCANLVMIQLLPVQAVPPRAPKCSLQWLHLAALSASMLCRYVVMSIHVFDWRVQSRREADSTFL